MSRRMWDGVAVALGKAAHHQRLAQYREAQRTYVEAVAAYQASRSPEAKRALEEARKTYLTAMAAPKETR